MSFSPTAWLSLTKLRSVTVCTILVRLFASQLLNAEERYAAQKRHAGHYLQVLAAADDLYLKGGESVTQGLALFDAEWTNIQTGHELGGGASAG